MAYSEISIVAPSSASTGSQVEVEVRIKNLCDYTIYATPVVNVNGDVAEGSYETIVPGQTLSWPFNFTMPDTSVMVTAESWCEDTFEWQLDATAQELISLAAADMWSTVGPLLVLGLMAGMMSMMAPMMKEGFK